jgi:hypothetical protein
VTSALCAAACALLAPATTHIDGYATSPSVAPGQRLALHASTTPAARYRVEVLRLGWYGGRGAKRVACLPSCSGDRRGATRRTRPGDRATGLRAANWPVSGSLRIPRGWAGGYYVARFVLTRGRHAGESHAHPFVVRAGPGARRARILVVVPVNTWQAYNPWGGRSLYDFNSRPRRAVKVSFARPYAELWHFLAYDVSLLRFLERNHRAADYATDVDVDRDPGLLTGRRLVMTAGHGEYWTRRERDAFEAARARGENLVFMGSDTGTAQVRYEAGRRTLVNYRVAADDPEPDPAAKTLSFVELSRPPCGLLGVEYVEGLSRRGDPPRAYTVTVASSDPWLRGTGLERGDVLGDLVGHEWDSLVPGCRAPDPTVLFHWSGRGTSADAVRYTDPSGARVFATGSLQFVWGLDPWGAHAVGGARRSADARLQRFMRNVLRDLAG